MLGNGQKLIHWKLGGSQKQIGSMLRSTPTSKATTLGKQQPTKEITLGILHPSRDIKLTLHGLKIWITCGVLQASIIDIHGQTLVEATDTWDGQRLTSGIKIGGRFISGPGQICFGATNSGNAGISGIVTTNGTDGLGKVGPQQNSSGGVGIWTMQQCGAQTVTVGFLTPPPEYWWTPESWELSLVPSPKSMVNEV